MVEGDYSGSNAVEEKELSAEPSSTEKSGMNSCFVMVVRILLKVVRMFCYYLMNQRKKSDPRIEDGGWCLS